MIKTFRPSVGHILDIDPAELAEQFLTRAHNVNTRKGFPSRRGGRRIAYPVSAGGMPNDPFHLLNFNLNSFNWWLSFGASSIYAVEGANSHDVSIAAQQTVANPYEWTSGLLNGIPVFNNGKDRPMFWTGDASDDAAVLPDWPVATVCKAVAIFRYHIFALNIDGPGGIFDNQIKWSDAAEPGAIPQLWTPTASNEAGDLILADTPGRCIAGKALGQQLLIYKPTSVYAVEYNGQPDQIFTQRPVNRTLGVLGPHCIADMGTQHLIVGNDDAVLTDGINFRSIAENRIKSYLANSIDETNAQNAYVVRDANKRETWVCVPEAGNQFATIAHIWDEARDTWVTRDLMQSRYSTIGFVTDATVDDTWDGDSGTWDSDVSTWNQGSVGSISRIVTAEEDVIYVEDTTDLVTLTAMIAKYDINFDSDEESKFTQRVWVRGTGLGAADLQVRLGSRDSTENDIAWGPLVAVADDGIDYEVSGRYISIEIQATGQYEWTINRFIVEARLNGPY